MRTPWIVKVACVADYGNVWRSHAEVQVTKRKSHTVNKTQAKALTQEWAKARNKGSN